MGMAVGNLSNNLANSMAPDRGTATILGRAAAPSGYSSAHPLMQTSVVDKKGRRQEGKERQRGKEGWQVGSSQVNA